MKKSNPIDQARTAMHGKDVLILGGSPNLKLPSDYTKEWCLVTVNASGAVAKKHSLEVPGLAVFAISALIKSESKFAEVRKYTSGLEANTVLLRMLGGGTIKRFLRVRRAATVLDRSGYRCQHITGLYPEDWRVVITQVMGDEHQKIARNISTGVFCVLLAIYSGAKRVVVSGIDPESIGHSYSKSNGLREHSNADIRTLSYVMDNYPVEVLKH